MKRQEILKLTRKFAVLLVMLGALFFFVAEPGVQSVGAAPCCSSCEVYPGDDEITYCENLCGGSSGSCYSSCLQRVYRCWQWCNFSC